MCKIYMGVLVLHVNELYRKLVDKLRINQKWEMCHYSSHFGGYGEPPVHRTKAITDLVCVKLGIASTKKKCGAISAAIGCNVFSVIYDCHISWPH